jgi:hypothetical protein
MNKCVKWGKVSMLFGDTSAGGSTLATTNPTWTALELAKFMEQSYPLEVHICRSKSLEIGRLADWHVFTCIY